MRASRWLAKENAAGRIDDANVWFAWDLVNVVNFMLSYGQFVLKVGLFTYCNYDSTEHYFS